MTLGIIFAIISGLTWVAVGAVVGLAEKRGCGSMRQQLVSNSLSGSIALIVLGAGLALRPGAAAFSLRCDLRSAIWMMLCGYLNYWMVIYMGRAMLRGPNGVVWTIVQSGFVFPFTMGVALGNTPLTAANVAGVVCVLAGVAFSGRAKSGGGASGKVPSAAWLPSALIGFVLCGSNQCAICLASMGPVESRPTPLVRIVLLAIGAFSGVVPHMLYTRLRQGDAPRDPDIGAKYRYLLRICGIGAMIYFVSTFFFQFNALDRLEAAGRIAIANSLMLAACLVGFAIYGALALRERITGAQVLGTIFAILGIVLVTI